MIAHAAWPSSSGPSARHLFFFSFRAIPRSHGQRHRGSAVEIAPGTNRPNAHLVQGTFPAWTTPLIPVRNPSAIRRRHAPDKTNRHSGGRRRECDCRRWRVRWLFATDGRPDLLRCSQPSASIPSLLPATGTTQVHHQTDATGRDPVPPHRPGQAAHPQRCRRASASRVGPIPRLDAAAVRRARRPERRDFFLPSPC